MNAWFWLVAVVVFGLWIWRRSTTVRTPRQATRFALKNFAVMHAKDWQKLERFVAKSDPGSPERHLLYCMRISSVVPTTKTLKAFKSRARVVFLGNDSNFGLSFASESPSYGAVESFLEKLFSDKFNDLMFGKSEEEKTREKIDLPFEYRP